MPQEDNLLFNNADHLPDGTFADELNAHIKRLTELHEGRKPDIIKLTTEEQEVLWYLKKGISHTAIKKNTRHNDDYYSEILSELSKKIGTTHYKDVGTVLDMIQFASRDYYPDRLAETFTILLGATVVMPLSEDGFSGLRLALIDGRRVNLWITDDIELEAPGSGFLEIPEDPGVMGWDDFASVRRQVACHLDRDEARALHDLLEKIAQEAITWLDRIDGDPDNEIEDAEDQGDGEPHEAPVTLNPHRGDTFIDRL